MLSELVPSEGFLECIPGDLWQRLFQLLLLPDVQLVLLSLDTLYQFTSQGSSVAAAAIFRGVSRYGLGSAGSGWGQRGGCGLQVGGVCREWVRVPWGLLGVGGNKGLLTLP